ncbi:MAG: nuclear transport factor 2 family protein [Acidobacteriota bacterium]
MKIACCAAGLAALMTLAAGAQSPAPTDQDREAIRQAAYDYAEGYYEGAAERMARAVHPALVKRGVVTRPGFGSLLVPMNAVTLVEATRNGGGKTTPPDTRGLFFALLDLRADVASARIFTVGFNDYLHLVKQDGAWRIAHVLWQPPSPTGAANADADTAAVTKAVTDLVAALSGSDAARIEPLVHPEAALRSLRPSPASGQTFITEGNRDSIMAAAAAKAVPPMIGAESRVLDVYDTIASAVTTTGATVYYWHLAKQKDQWRVVNLLRR